MSFAPVLDELGAPQATLDRGMLLVALDQVVRVDALSEERGDVHDEPDRERVPIRVQEPARHHARREDPRHPLLGVTLARAELEPLFEDRRVEPVDFLDAELRRLAREAGRWADRGTQRKPRVGPVGQDGDRRGHLLASLNDAVHPCALPQEGVDGHRSDHGGPGLLGLLREPGVRPCPEDRVGGVRLVAPGAVLEVERNGVLRGQEAEPLSNQVPLERHLGLPFREDSVEVVAPQHATREVLRPGLGTPLKEEYVRSALRQADRRRTAGHSGPDHDYVELVRHGRGGDGGEPI